MQQHSSHALAGFLTVWTSVVLTFSFSDNDMNIDKLNVVNKCNSIQVIVLAAFRRMHIDWML